MFLCSCYSKDSNFKARAAQKSNYVTEPDGFMRPSNTEIKKNEAYLGVRQFNPNVNNVANVSPKIRRIEKEYVGAWNESTSKENQEYNQNNGIDTQKQSFDWNGQLEDLIAGSDGDRIRKSHNEFVKEASLKSQTTMLVDDLDEAFAMSATNRHGIRAFSFKGVPQNNPLFITEMDAETINRNYTPFKIG
jgi:hypothetical protein